MGDSTSNIQHNIFKVHYRLRRHNKEEYEPECLSIGPYHRGKVNLQVMEKHKRRFLQEVLEDPKSEFSGLGRYIAALTNVEEKARKYYGDEISLSKDDFVEMMLLDGCFILEFLRKCNNPRLRVQEDNNIFNVQWLLNTLVMDLILFENQVPFFILVILFNMTRFRDPSQQNLTGLAMIPLAGILKVESVPNYDAPGDNQVIHLLDLLHRIYSSSFAAKFTSADDGDDGGDDLFEHINSTSTLEESGVKFEKATENEVWLNITWENGVMKIPQLNVNDGTERLLRNLIAYEQYSLGSCQRKYITDYVTVMDLLINSPVDVEKLRHRQIIKNLLGDDEAVSTMFNKLLKDVIVNPKLFCYRVVLKEAYMFSSKRMNKWRAILMRNYFNTPWSIISFLAAVVLLILTFLQTVFTIRSSNKN